MTASEDGDKTKEREVISWLSSQISGLMQEGLLDLTKLKHESNRLKLIATDEMLATFDEIECLNQKLFELTAEYMNNFTEIFMYQQTEKTDLFQERAKVLGEELQQQSQNLLRQMRREIIDI